VVTSAAYDAARLVASSEGDGDAQGGAEDHARQLLGCLGSQASFDWSRSDGDDVVLRVRAEVPSVMFRPWRRSLPFGEIDRTVRLRVERFR
jgi:hypothetical protein